MLSNLGHTQLPNAVVSMVYRLESTDVNLHRKTMFWISCFSEIKCSQGQSTGSCMGETGEREGRVGVICESDLGRHVFICIAYSNVVQI